MSRSQETFNKKLREKKRAKKKETKTEKRGLRKSNSAGGLEIDWSSAPENKTLSESEKTQKSQNQVNGKSEDDDSES